MFNQRHARYMNPYMQGHMTGQYSPMHYSQQNQQRQHFTPPPPMPMYRPQQQQGGGLLDQGKGENPFAGWQKFADILGKKKMANQVAQAVVPPITPNPLAMNLGRSAASGGGLAQLISKAGPMMGFL